MTDIVTKTEHRVTITVVPTEADHAGLLRVDDALQQVLAFLRVAEDGKDSLGRVHEDFEWVLFSASTNSPLTVVATAKPLNPSVDVASHVMAVKEITARTFRKVANGEPIPEWLRPDGVAAIRGFFKRNANGIASTILDLPGVDVVEIDNAQAAPIALTFEREEISRSIPSRIAHGEINGRLVAVGTYRNKPALYLRTSLYGMVWAVLGEQLIDTWADAQRMSDVWKGKRLTVFGRLIYGAGGKSLRVDPAQNVREREVAKIDIEKIFDPDFTAGLDPVEYVDRLHEGELG